MDYPPKGNLLYPPISLHSHSFSLPKTERKKDQKKEKIEKKGTKKRKNFLQIFPVDPLPLFHKKEFKMKENRIRSYSQTRKEIEKRAKILLKTEEKKQKKSKKRRKRRLLSFSVPVPLLSQKRK